jgi:GrpB-like predicted nucleotidyltransferase (UPF0157 family)
MSPPVVELVPHDPAWADAAKRESLRLIAATGDAVIQVHHIGSTAIPGILAKPILDLMPIVRSLPRLDEARSAIEALGYDWKGELGISGRRFCILSDPTTGRRRVHVHCFAEGSPEVMRHLAFRDHLRARPDLAQAYEAIKARCRDLHPLDMLAYNACKNDWIRRVEAEALANLPDQRE